MSRSSRESIMTALLNALSASVQTSFTADTTSGSATLANVSTTTGLFIGLPVFGVGIPHGSTIQSLLPMILTQPATATAAGVSMTTGFLTISRRFKPWTEVTAQPALFLRDADEDMTYQNIILQHQTMKAEVWIYSRAGDNPDIAPATALNNLLDAVQAAFTPDDAMQYRFTLGGLVEWCRIEGKIQKSPGDLDGQAIAVADVVITVP